MAAARTGPLPPVHAEGRWLVDAAGRVLVPHGVNEVTKGDPYAPAGAGFGDDDAAFLAAEGITAVRVGVVPSALLPEPGVVDDTYLDRIAETVDALAHHGILTLLDLHQDEWGPAVHGNGMPAWMTITDGLPNPDVPFPGGYLQNPALQRAFDHFWADDPGPDGVGIQTAYLAGVQRLAARFASDPWVFGYDLMNEPWPGTDWAPCLTGCPDVERALLAPFVRRAVDAVRAAGSRQLLFAEPFVLFNFGGASTDLPSLAPGSALSAHVYAVDATGERAAAEQAVAAAQRAGAPVLVTEFGATGDPATLRRLTGVFDDLVAPWTEWAYNEWFLHDDELPPTPDNVRQDVLDALVRPSAVAVAGVPTTIAYDPATRVLDLEYTTTPPGRHRPSAAPTVVATPHASTPTATG